MLCSKWARCFFCIVFACEHFPYFVILDLLGSLPLNSIYSLILCFKYIYKVNDSRIYIFTSNLFPGLHLCRTTSYHLKPKHLWPGHHRFRCWLLRLLSDWSPCFNLQCLPITQSKPFLPLPRMVFSDLWFVCWALHPSPIRWPPCHSTSQWSKLFPQSICPCSWLCLECFYFEGLFFHVKFLLKYLLSSMRASQTTLYKIALHPLYPALFYTMSHSWPDMYLYICCLSLSLLAGKLLGSRYFLWLIFWSVTFWQHLTRNKNSTNIWRMNVTKLICAVKF